MEIARRNGWPRRWVISYYTYDDFAWNLAYEQLYPYVDLNKAQASIRQAFVGGSLDDHKFVAAVSPEAVAIVAHAEAEAARASAIRKANKKKAKNAK